ncbi:MAG: SusD/RagB family nutrient-binding outer membrane lipoprotein [Tannerellaceae bacterium]|nr:SusD/RagB family nutrient-binding outer membrane lipoprotein [Tannerellaceae bacterium]
MASLDWPGDKYLFNQGYNQAFWERQYENSIRDAVDLLYIWKDNEEYYAERQMVRIMKVLVFHRMTDMYGDVPYFEAGLGYHEGIAFPKYDPQRDIYMDMLKELKEAGDALATVSSSRIGNADLLYRGDVVKWRKFANSLMLRLAMRLTKVEPQTAQTWVQTAVNGGLFTSIEDDAYVSHVDSNINDDSSNPYGKVMAQLDPQNIRMSRFFIDLLQDSNDPRLRYISTLCENPNLTYLSGEMQYGDTTAVIQVGMPNGYDSDGIRPISEAPGFPGSIDDYSVPNRYTYANPDAPTLVVTHAENQLLLAEAALRGWVSGNPADYYNEGVRASMRQYVHFNVDPVTEAEIEACLTDNPFNTATGYEQINTQYYIITFCDEYETFANWRRSGYPELTPVPYYPGNVTDGTIPRRFVYRNNEQSVNERNYQEAVSRLPGGDRMTSRVWWDVDTTTP